MNDLSMPAVHAEPGTDLHAGISPAVRSPLYRAAYNGRVEARVSERRQRKKGRGLGGKFEDAGLAGDSSPLGQHHHAIRNLVAAVIADAAYEFRADRRRAVNDCKRSYPLEFAERVGLDRALRAYAGRWITGTGTKPFGFEWCCISLDLEPDRVRQGIFDQKRSNGDTRRNSVKAWEEKRGA